MYSKWKQTHSYKLEHYHDDHQMAQINVASFVCVCVARRNFEVVAEMLRADDLQTYIDRSRSSFKVH